LLRRAQARDTNDSGNQAFARLRRLLGNVLNDVHSALIKEITHLLRNPVPRTGGIIMEDQTDYRQQHKNTG
jgi:hypothetical protein